MKPSNLPVKITMEHASQMGRTLDEAIATASAILAAKGYTEPVIDQEVAFALAHRAAAKGIDIAGEELRQAREIQAIMAMVPAERADDVRLYFAAIASGRRVKVEIDDRKPRGNGSANGKHHNGRGIL